jgi:hypothetical protein
MVMLLGLIAGFIACNKIDYQSGAQSMTQTIARTLTGNPPTIYNYVMVYSGQTVDFGDSSYTITGNAAFTDSPNQVTGAITRLAINGQQLSVNATDNSYYIDFTDTSSIGLLRPAIKAGALLTLPGTSYTVQVAGSSSADTVTQNVYLPKNLLRYASDFPGAKLNIGNDLLLNWVPDAGNTIGSVAIQVAYDSVLSQATDSVLPKSVAPLIYTVPDNGSYTISATALQVFPPKGYVTIGLARTTQYLDVLPISKKSIYFWGTITLQTPPLLVSGCGAGCTGPSHKCLADTCTAGHLTILARQSSPTQCVTTWGYVFPDGTAQVDSTVVTAGPCN